MAKPKIPSNAQLVGRWVRTKWDDVGCIDGIVIASSPTSLRVYHPFDSETNSCDRDQIVAVGKYLECKDTGL